MVWFSTAKCTLVKAELASCVCTCNFICSFTYDNLCSAFFSQFLTMRLIEARAFTAKWKSTKVKRHNQNNQSDKVTESFCFCFVYFNLSHACTYLQASQHSATRWWRVTCGRAFTRWRSRRRFREWSTSVRYVQVCYCALHLGHVESFVGSSWVKCHVRVYITIHFMH